MRISFYLYDATFDVKLKAQDDEISVCLINLQKVTEQVRANEETTYITNRFYLQEIVQGLPIIDILYSVESSEDITADEIALLAEIVAQSQNTGESELETLIDNLQKGIVIKYCSLIRFYSGYKPTLLNELIVHDFSTYTMLHRYFLLNHIEDINEFINNLNVCFPNLHFGVKVYEAMQIFKPLKIFKVDLVKHFSVLSDEALQFYQNYGEEQALRHIKGRGVECSGQGDPEYVNENLVFEFKNDKESIETVRCGPHTKIYYAGKHYRIYFSWGKENISGGKKILVGHAGKHK